MNFTGIGAVTLETGAFLSWLAFTSCKGALIALLVLGIRQLLSTRLSPQGKVLLWLVAILAFVIPVGWQLSMPVSQLSRVSELLDLSDSVQTTKHLAPTLTISDTDDGFDDVALSNRIYRTETAALKLAPTMTRALVGIWLVGAFVLSGLLIANYLHFVRIKRSTCPVDTETRSLFDTCRAHLRVTRNVQVLTTAGVQSPTLFGVWSPTLLLPINFTREFSSVEVRHVFLHELAHARRLDLLVQWSAALIQVLHWFNPIVWILGQKLRCDVECACDAHVLRALTATEQRAYGHSLIRVAELPVAKPFVVQARMVDSHAQLKARIQMINHFNTRRSHSFMAWLALTLTAPLALAQWNDERPTANPSRSDSTATAQNVSRPPASPTVLTAASLTAATTPSKPSPVNGDSAMRALYLKITYVNAADVQALIQPGSGIALLSPRGSVAVDTRTNTLLVNDTEGRLSAVRELVANVDVPLRRIRIDARIAVTDSDASRELMSRHQRVDDASPTKYDALKQMNVGYNADADLEAIQSASKGEIVSAPRIITENRKQATIQQGISFPAFASDGEKQAGRFQNSVLTVTTRPVIAPDNRVHLYVTIRREGKEDKSSSSTVDKPDIDTYQISTEMLVNDGQTLVAVLPGLLGPEQKASSKLAGDLPQTNKKELLVFLTPKIVFEEASRSF